MVLSCGFLRAQDSSCSWLLSILRSLKANKKTLNGCNGTVVWFFTSPGQFMLVVAFNFKESESNKKTLKEWYYRVDLYEPRTVHARGCFQF